MSLKTDLISVMSWETLLSTSFSNPSVDRLMFPEDKTVARLGVRLIPVRVNVEVMTDLAPLCSLLNGLKV
jgi:hypothetical protein